MIFFFNNSTNMGRVQDCLHRNMQSGAFTVNTPSSVNTSPLQKWDLRNFSVNTPPLQNPCFFRIFEYIFLHEKIITCNSEIFSMLLKLYRFWLQMIEIICFSCKFVYFAVHFCVGYVFSEFERQIYPEKTYRLVFKIGEIFKEFFL